MSSSIGPQPQVVHAVLEFSECTVIVRIGTGEADEPLQRPLVELGDVVVAGVEAQQVIAQGQNHGVRNLLHGPGALIEDSAVGGNPRPRREQYNTP